MDGDEDGRRRGRRAAASGTASCVMDPSTATVAQALQPQMGLDPRRFCNDVDANLLCSICAHVFSDPVATPCGHTFCKPCLATWVHAERTRRRQLIDSTFPHEVPAADNTNSSHSSIERLSLDDLDDQVVCPQCRSLMMPHECRTIYNLKNLVDNMLVCCENAMLGCPIICSVERRLKHEQDDCAYRQATCPVCQQPMQWRQLSAHQRLHQSLMADDKLLNLEAQIGLLKKDLSAAEQKNKKIEKELKKTRQELEAKRSQLIDYKYGDFDPDYDYGETSDSITQLARLIGRHLLGRPTYIDRQRAYQAVKRCYERYRESHETDVHMLLATAYASTWFDHTERSLIGHWLDRVTCAAPPSRVSPPRTALADAPRRSLPLLDLAALDTAALDTAAPSSAPPPRAHQLLAAAPLRLHMPAALSAPSLSAEPLPAKLRSPTPNPMLFTAATSHVALARKR